MKTLPKLTPGRRAGFSLIELMVSITVLSMMLVIVLQMLEQMQRTWKHTRQSVSEFKDARTSFDELSRRIEQASLNAYYGYVWGTAPIPGGGGNVRYGRQITPESELQFVSAPNSVLFSNTKAENVGSRPGHGVFFQAPFGFCIQRDKDDNSRYQFEQLNSLLNAWGYYVEFNSDEMDRPKFLNTIKNAPAPRLRYRLMEFRQPTEYLQIYKLNLRDKVSSNQKEYYKWFTDGLFGVNSPWNTATDPPASGTTFFRTTRPMAENIIAMFIQPRKPTSANSNARLEDLAPDFIYDTRRWQWSTSKATNVAASKHQLPPIMDITFVAVDENSFSNYMNRNNITKVEDDPVLVDKETFVNAIKFTEDLKGLQDKLTSLKLDWRIFSASIRLREAKWIDN
ncbi:MAG: Verru_Chthon cassette protein C [Verrucomicrobiaceae bacterium]|nr:MAG: Verru_Chthon cassette protein C [Verrucomicrobiaceae bacterium]